MSESSLKNVRCPDPFVPLFQQAEKNMEVFFKEMRTAPDQGEITIQGERYILARAATFSIQLQKILEEEYGRLAAEKIVYNLGRAAGTKDAEFFMRKMGLSQGPEALSAGPVHFAHAGWAFVDILEESDPSQDEEYFLLYDHPYSFEADSYLNEKISTNRPVCRMNAGYSSGWCQVAFGIELVAKEISCRARGDAQCRFVMAHPSRINQYTVAMKEKYDL